jgi:polar amino acid transport system substrate-binding protein
MALEEENVLLFGTSQTLNRLSKFKWVGPLSTKRDILIARKNAGFKIDSLADAKKVGRIGTVRDDTREEYLKELGFENLESVSDEKLNAQKLKLGRIDLWVYKVPGLRTVCELAKVDPDQFEEVLHLRKTDTSMAFSLKTPDSIVDRWRGAFNAMISDGTIEAIRNKWNVE